MSNTEEINEQKLDSEHVKLTEKGYEVIERPHGGCEKGDKGDPGPAGKDGEKGDKGDPGPSYTLPAATTSALGGVKQAAKQADLAADAEAAAIVTSVNSLMKALRDAGVLEK